MAAKAKKKVAGKPLTKILPQAPEGRIVKRRKATRARLLRAAYEVMAEVGVDAGENQRHY